MAAAVAPRHVYRQWGHGITGHYRPASAAGGPRRRQRPAELEPCSTLVFDGLPAQTIWIKFILQVQDSVCGEGRTRWMSRRQIV